MQKHTFFSTWMQRSSLLLATMLAFSCAVYAQVNYLSVFGNAGCGTSGDNNYSMPCTVVPSSISFTSIPVLDGMDHFSGYTNVDDFKNSLYDATGHLLFSVNENGIYAPDALGTCVYAFGSYDILLDPVTMSLGSGTVIPNGAVSEITIFPVPGDCTGNKYYVVFMCSIEYPTDPAISTFFRCIEVDINPANFNTSAAPVSWYTISSDNALGGLYGADDISGSCQVVADAKNTDGSRDVYTITPGLDVTHIIDYSLINKWTFPATGGLPASSTTLNSYTYGSSNNLLPSCTFKAKILTMPSLAGSSSTTGMDKYLCFPSIGTGAYSNMLQTWDLTTNTKASAYTISVPIPAGQTTAPLPGYQQIAGFEYLPVQGSLIFAAYDDNSWAVPGGGLSYALPPSATTPGITTTPVSSTINYLFSDLELDKNNDLLLVYADIATGVNSLAYMPTHSAATTVSTAPTLFSSSCSGNISVNNWQVISNHPDRFSYLGNQIRGENYSAWGHPALDYVIPTGTSVIWSPGSNPVQNGASTINVNSITIQPGASLSISAGLTVQVAAGNHVDVLAAPSSPASGIGGRLTLNDAILTVYHGECGGTAMWGGVRVWGDPAQVQLTYALSHQGGLYMDHSTISYAQTGILAGQVAGGLLAGLIPYGSPAGGGIVQAQSSTFSNNTSGVTFWPYVSTWGTLGPAEYGNLSYFKNCTFTSTDINTIPPGSTLYGIQGIDVIGVDIYGSSFSNNSGTPYSSYGIYADDMAFIVDETGSGPYTPSTFSNYSCGIFHTNMADDHSATIKNAVFSGNAIGVELSGSVSPVVINNTFNIPFMEQHFGGFYNSIQSVGLLLQGASLYIVANNTFNQSGGTPFVFYGTTNKTVGILADNTEYGTDENLINNNFFNYLGTANLSNYKNRDGNDYGLWYKCNTYRNNLVDEATEGSNNNTSDGDGIRNHQGIEPDVAYTWGGMSLLATSWGSPSTNSFSSGSSVYNIYCDYLNTASFIYYDCGLPGTWALEIPNVPPTTGIDYGMTTLALSIEDDCVNPFSSVVHGHTTTIDVGATALPYNVRTTSPTYNYFVALNNIHYYMTNREGMAHRDSLYYWLGQVNSSAAKLVTANLLAEDGYADSATALFRNIPVTDTMDSVDNAEFTTWGSDAFNIQSKILAYNAAIGGVMQYAYSNALDPDSLAYADSSLFAPLVLTTVSQVQLTGAFNNSQHWGRILAENILRTYYPAAFDSMITAMPDTLLYPTLPDTLALPTWPVGVLAVTEISQGPASCTGSEYAELLVTNCGGDEAPYVNVAGFIIDDNSGNFDTAGCDATGITRGHYRLSPCSAVWQNIAVGSVIVVYNANANCYNLPNTFTIDSVHNIFWIPVSGALDSGSSVLQRYDGSENASPDSYCSDTGATVYTPAYGWEQTIALAPQDAIQVRCPGCTVAYPAAPAFYQGLGYAPDHTSCFQSIPAGANSPGGPVVYNDHANQKYVFRGSSARDFADRSQWTADNADAAGAPPHTLGYVNRDLHDAAINHTLGLPCCGSGGGDGGRKTNPAHPTVNAPAVQNIKVYPNPATMTLYFEFPAGDVTVKLMDVTGRIMDQQQVHNSATASFNVKGYTPGMYMYQVITKTNTQNGKILIE